MKTRTTTVFKFRSIIENDGRYVVRPVVTTNIVYRDRCIEVMAMWFTHSQGDKHGSLNLSFAISDELLIGSPVTFRCRQVDLRSLDQCRHIISLLEGIGLSFSHGCHGYMSFTFQLSRMSFSARVMEVLKVLPPHLGFKDKDWLKTLSVAQYTEVLPPHDVGIPLGVFLLKQAGLWPEPV